MPGCPPRWHRHSCLCGASGSSAIALSSSLVDRKHRNLPHWTQSAAIYWVTFRLVDALPKEKLHAWQQEREAWLAHNPEPWSEGQWTEYDKRFSARLEKWLDCGFGARALARPDIRETVKEAILRFDGERHVLHACIIMPTHVHMLMEPLNGHSLPNLLKGIKGGSARSANKLLGTNAAFWLDESYDHIVRSEKQYGYLLRYIEQNPTKAGLRSDEYWLHLPHHVAEDAISTAQTGMSVPPWGGCHE